jgi:hypothetical protein
VFSGQNPFQYIAQILQEVPAIRYLDGIGRALATTLGVVLPAIPTDDLDLVMRREPGRECFRGSVGEEIYRTVAFVRGQE